MTSKLTVLTTSGTPESIGTAHGSRFAADIVSYMGDRRTLSREGTSLTAEEVTGIANKMIDAHRTYDADLFEEMEAMADAAGISVGEAIIVGGYTDFIDTVRAVAGGTAIEDTCTAVITPDATSGGAGCLAQTWDMHSSATPHVFLLDVTPEGAPHCLVFTTHGTLGQIGMNEKGIAVGINNLTVTDGRYGVTWPFVVRKALKATTIEEAIDAITAAPLAGGHNFLIFDARGNGVSVEATPSTTAVETLSDVPLVHTNHCLVPATQAVEANRPAELQNSSTLRLAHAIDTLAEAEHNVGVLQQMLRDERAICRHPEPPFSYESSGAVIMRPRTRDFWACWGIPSESDFVQYRVEAS
jgi:isopenicillin-N N-acyltransferase-like protein